MPISCQARSPVVDIIIMGTSACCCDLPCQQVKLQVYSYTRFPQLETLLAVFKIPHLETVMKILNFQISFELVRRLFSNLEDAAEHRETAKHLESGAVLKAPNADLYFGHAVRILLFLEKSFQRSSTCSPKAYGHEMSFFCFIFLFLFFSFFSKYDLLIERWRSRRCVADIQRRSPTERV